MSHRHVRTIDCAYLFPEFAAAYALIEGPSSGGAGDGTGEVAFVDNNTAHSVPRLLASLREAGMSTENVRYLIVTHVHLDHAAGTSKLLAACPNAEVLVHPRGARHLIDPAKLIASARQVYGDARFTELYGEIAPIPAKRVRSLEDGERVSFGAGPALEILYTRGHANHHLCVYEPETRSVFTGDAFGLRYPALQGGGLFVMPSTSPTDFIYTEAMSSIERILATGAAVAYPTHFGAVHTLPESAEQLRELLKESERVRAEAVLRPESGGELTEYCRSRLSEAWVAFLERRGLRFETPEWELLRLDLDLNAQGIAFVAEKARLA